ADEKSFVEHSQFLPTINVRQSPDATQGPASACYSRAPLLRTGRPRCGSMSPERLNILFLSHMPASPPRSGAQARPHGLMTQLAQRHDLTATMLVDDEFDLDQCRRVMQTYCHEVVLVPNPYGQEGPTKRLLQLRSLASSRSFERLRVTV